MEQTISKYLTLKEATYSQTAIAKKIDNRPNEDQLEAMRFVATKIFDPVREFVGAPLYASSFFRSAALNKLIGGSSKTSQHMKGEAIDIDCDMFGNSTNLEVFEFIRKNLSFDQLILEYPDAIGKPSWIHVSLCRDSSKNRQEILVKLQAKYIPYSMYKIGMI